VDNIDRGNEPDQAGDPRPAAVTFVTTEHFTLQGARSSTISESTGRASVFLGAVSGGLAHHLQLLGPDPANWTTAPVSP
jgi:hypothetical protein